MNSSSRPLLKNLALSALGIGLTGFIVHAVNKDMGNYYTQDGSFVIDRSNRPDGSFTLRRFKKTPEGDHYLAYLISGNETSPNIRINLRYPEEETEVNRIAHENCGGFTVENNLNRPGLCFIEGAAKESRR